MVPTGLADQVTAVLLLPMTVAENCCVWEAVRLAVPGAMETVIGGASVTVAVPALVGSATLVAVTVTDCVPEMVAGAVKSPVAEMVPTGLADQVTAVLLLPVTVAENSCVWETVRLAVPGVIEIAIGGLRVTVAVACFVESAALVAVIVTVCAVD